MAIAVKTDQSRAVSPTPEREDGASWPFALLLSDETIWADTLTELVGKLIDGYDQYADDEGGDQLAFLARVDHAANIVAESQAVILAGLTQSGEFDPEKESEMVLTALLTPRGTGLVDGAEFGGQWDHTVPLVLLTTDYKPFTEHEPITGNVQYLDPSDERTYLTSLEAFGYVELFVNADID